MAALDGWQVKQHPENTKSLTTMDKYSLKIQTSTDDGGEMGFSVMQSN